MSEKAVSNQMRNPLSSGPWCPFCGAYLGTGYSDGDVCLECFEEAEDNEAESSNGRNQK